MKYKENQPGITAPLKVVSNVLPSPGICNGYARDGPAVSKVRLNSTAPVEMQQPQAMSTGKFLKQRHSPPHGIHHPTPEGSQPGIWLFEPFVR